MKKAFLITLFYCSQLVLLISVGFFILFVEWWRLFFLIPYAIGVIYNCVSFQLLLKLKASEEDD